MNTNDLIHRYRKETTHRIIGLMSGTSLDGVDAVLVTITSEADGHVESVTLEDQVAIPYTNDVKAMVNRLCVKGASDIEDLCFAHFGLAHWNGEAVNRLIEHSGVKRDSIAAIGMHGQTVWHAPVPRTFPGPEGSLDITGTLQIGNAQMVASLTGLPVISDFRSADMAEGGEGAPLAPYIDYLLFHQEGKGIAVQNIGGIGNVTVLPQGGDEEAIFAFDTGPGNMIIDQIVALGTHQKQQYDDGGTIAARGTVSIELLTQMMRDPYFAKKPPKSTGREVYGSDYSEQVLKQAEALKLSFEDVVATATAFTAKTIASSYKDFVLPVTALDTVVVSGGGARNKTLLSMIQGYLPEGITVKPSDEVGVPDQAREAMAFALMAHESLMGRPSNIPKVTGAKRRVVLGTITMQQL
jgi:anhydro-N-acetylmuramic acid kinase